MHCKTASALAIAFLAGLPLLASAQLTGNVSLTTNYKFRGQDQDVIGSRGEPKTSAFKPAIQGGFDYAFGETGWYVGNWNSSVNWQPGNSIESDLYGGYKFKAGVFDLDVGVLTFVYPGNSAGNTTELYGAGSYSDPVIGAFTLKYSHTVSSDYFGYAGSAAGSGLKGRNSGYLNLAYTKEIVPKVTLKAALGYTHLSGDIRSRGFPSFVDYNVGAAYDLGSGLSLAGAVQGATRQAAYATVYGLFGERSFSPNKARLVVTLTKTL
ncbi:MAG: hypothetical protein JWQ03_2236 [Variovorax sp.]|nr:hypothetical protein [Variovorax sp.]